MSDKNITKVFFNRYDLVSQSAVHFADKVADASARQTEKLILEQLKELSSRGLLVIEETEPMLSMVQMAEDQNGFELRIVRGVRLLLKDQEYVESLEKKISDLETQLNVQNELFEKITVAMKKQQE